MTTRSKSFSIRPIGRIAALGVLLAVAGCSGSSIPDTDRVFLSAAGGWDRNRDGVVTCDEWKAYAAELFDAADADRDGIIDRTEYSKIIVTDRMFETLATLEEAYFYQSALVLKRRTRPPSGP